ncbi:hypothetical protein [Streptomyces sp. B8F3]|uniref:hypothetical protein n=1 Tax=unclassified Streptomyces TaxID=2593676 RepID=UPI00325EAC58
MGEIDEFRRRLDARHLAVNSDRDVAALQEQRRADIQLLQALRQTQLEQGKVLEAHGKTLLEHSKVLGVLVSGQVAIMEHLGITPPETAADGG